MFYIYGEEIKFMRKDSWGVHIVFMVALIGPSFYYIMKWILHVYLQIVILIYLK